MGLMNKVRAYAALLANVDSDTQSGGVTKLRSTNQYELVSAEETNSYQFVLRKDVTPRPSESQYKQNRMREDEAGHPSIDRDEPLIASVPDLRSTNWYELNPSAAVSTLGEWLVSGQLDTLPNPVPGFPDDLARYRDRETLIAFTRHILACAPWSVTGEERAAQFVAVLAPLMEGQAA